MTGEELTLGQIGISVLLSVILRMLYNTVEIGNRLKPWLAVGIGIGLSIVALYYGLRPGEDCGFRMVVDYVVRGFMCGATAVGLYEMTKLPAKKDGGQAGYALIWPLLAMLVAAVLWIQLPGCATPQPGAEATIYKTLKVSANAYEFAMPLLADFYERGILDRAEWDRAAQIGTVYAVAYHAAVEAAIAFKRTHAEEDAARLNKALAASAEALARFVEFARPLLLKGGINL